MPAIEELGIEIEPQPWRFGSTDGKTLPSGGGAVTLIYISGEPLIDIVRRCELPSASADGQPGLAGSYRPLCGYRFDPGLFFGQPRDPELRRPDGVVLMGCDCGVVGCWPLVCAVEVADDVVIWKSFRQPFRPKWDHGALRPMVFDRRAYERQVERAHEGFVKLVANSPEQHRNYEERARVLRAKYPDHHWPDWSEASGARGA